MAGARIKRALTFPFSRVSTKVTASLLTSFEVISAEIQPSLSSGCQQRLVGQS